MNDLLRKAREDQGWTQQELADKLKVGETTVRSWERGIRTPSLASRNSLCSIFGLTPKQLGLAESPQELMTSDPSDDLPSSPQELPEAHDQNAESGTLPNDGSEKERKEVQAHHSSKPESLDEDDQSQESRSQHSLLVPQHSNKQEILMKKNRGKTLRIAGFVILLLVLSLVVHFIIPMYLPSIGIAASPTPTPTVGSTPTPTPSPSPTPTPTKKPVSTITDLGILNFQTYCRSIGDTASLDTKNAYGWMCVKPSGTHVLIDADAACQQQYNQPNVLSRLVDFSDPSNWHCYSPVKNLGSINIAQYCRSIGNSARLQGSTAYDWRCVTPSGTSVLVDTNVICSWQYSQSALASVSNYYDPNGWFCLGLSPEDA